MSADGVNNQIRPLNIYLIVLILCSLSAAEPPHIVSPDQND